MNLYTQNGQKITIEDKEFAAGGEGKVHKIASPLYKDCCVKLYYNKHGIVNKQQKIEFMVKNPPVDLKGPNYIICWPREIVFQKNHQFIGFIMPLTFPDSQLLYELCIQTRNDKLPATWQHKYNRRTGEGVIARMKLCTNLAAYIHRVHFLKKYVFADMKPQNILVTDSGKVSLIDLDSIQIAKSNQVLFSAPVSTPEYEPPESKMIKTHGNLALGESWDRFSMAVIFYEILFGIHPYVATFSNPYQSFNAISEFIQNNLFVHGKNKKYVLQLPHLHNNYYKIPASLQSLFVRAFEANPAQRPSAEEFGKTFVEELKRIPPSQQSNLQQFKCSLQQPQKTLELAPLKCRATAYIIDSFVFIFSVSLVVFALHRQNIDDIISLIIVILMYFYFWGYSLTTSWQATLGKKLIGIIVTDESGKKLTLLKSFVRQFIFIVSMPIFFLSILILLVNKRKQALHDLIAKTIVVKTKGSKLC